MISDSVTTSQMKHSKLIKLSLTMGLSLIMILLSASSALATSGTQTYLWFAAGDSICEPGSFPPCPDVATASNGDTIDIRGEGTLTIHPKSATGNGTFVHKDPQGNVLGSGTWYATELLSFKSYGPSGDPTLPADWRAGKAVIRVHMMADGGFEADAILTVGCILPEVKVPGGAGGENAGGLFEGATLKVQDGLNFNKPSLGLTLFIEL